jgi:hypothetical protein
LYAIKEREVIFNKQPSICIYRLKERFSLQNDPFIGGFTMCVFGSKRCGREYNVEKALGGNREYIRSQQTRLLIYQ